MKNKQNILDTSHDIKFMSETDFNRNNLSRPPPPQYTIWAPFQFLHWGPLPPKEIVSFLGGLPLPNIRNFMGSLFCWVLKMRKATIAVC